MRSYTGKNPEDFNFQFIKYTKKDLVATVTFNRPEVYNCVTGPMLIELIEAFQDVAWDDSVAVLVLTGEGDKAFCTGADMKEQQQFTERPRDYYKWMGLFIECHEKLRTIGKPTIARLNGIVVGGGNEFNMSCDLAIAADDVYIRQVGASHGSVAAAGATQWLPIIVGDRRAREILMLNEEIPAKLALEWGLVNRVVAREKLDEEVAKMAATLMNKLPEIMRYTKQQLNFWKELSWHLTIGHARDWLSIHNVSPEVHEGVRAFAEKRKPNYSALFDKIKSDDSPEYHNGGVPNKICPSCGSKYLPEYSKFCLNCGSKIN